MATPHKHAPFVKAWADGKPLQLWDGATWRDLVDVPSWLEDSVFRVKPDRYRRYVVENHYEGGAPTTIVEVANERYGYSWEDAEASRGFVRWIDYEWQEVPE